MKIAVLTFHRAYNCGAMLQAWALQMVLKRLGHDVEFPDLNEIGLERAYWLVQDIPPERRGFSWVYAFCGRLLLDLMRGHKLGTRSAAAYEKFGSRLNRGQVELGSFSERYDVVVVGSDQVFNPDITREWTSLFLCEQVSTRVARISYAASFGDKALALEDQTRLMSALQSFSAVSFREPFQNYEVVLDPTLLLKAADFDAIGTKNPRGCMGEFVFMYTILGTEYELAVARAVARALKLKLIVMSAHSREFTGQEKVVRHSPDDFVNLMRRARYVIAASFHGTAFAIIFRKQFLSLRNNPEEDWSRPSMLLSRLGLSDRLVTPSVDVEQAICRLQGQIDAEAYVKLDAMRARSVAWLSEALGKVKNK